MEVEKGVVDYTNGVQFRKKDERRNNDDNDENDSRR